MAKTMYYIVEKLPTQGRISFFYEMVERDEYQAEITRAVAYNVLESYGAQTFHNRT